MFRILPVATLLAALTACSNNVGSLWDRDKTGGPGTGSEVAVVPLDGRVVEGRPRVEDAFPTGNGWPTTVPIVVWFSESMARESFEAPSSGGGGGLPGVQSGAGVQLRLEGSPQPLPVALHWLLGDRAVVLIPAAPLVRDQSYEVTVDPEVKDVDTIRLGGSEPEVVATFRTDQADSIEDGRIVAVLPPDNARNVLRESSLLVLFDRPVDPTTVDAASFRLEVGGTPVAGARAFPVRTAGIDDPRVLRFVPADPLASAARHELVVTDAIRFGTGVLEFEGRTPFSVFDTAPGAAPTRVEVGNAVPGFPNQINATNLANAVIDVDVDASVRAGSRVVVRIYGGDPTTEAADDLDYVVRGVDVLQDGPTTVSVPVGDLFGAPADPRLAEGPLTIVARVDVDGAASGYAEADPDTEPGFDVTPPEITAFLMAVPGAPNDLATDQESIAVMGRASEPLGEVELSAGTATVGLFGAQADGTFVLRPLALGRRTAPLPFTMSIRDAAGNTSPQPISGNIVQRGLVSGTAAGTLTVEAYDDATFAPLAGALVVVEPDLPQKPAVGRVTAVTGADGRATLQVGAARHTITVVAAGYDLVTVLDTPAAFASLPLRPVDDAAATATLTVALGFVPTGGLTGLVGCNAFDDELVLERPTAGTPPVTLTDAAVRAGRPLVVHAVTGVFPPTALPAVAGFACVLCGPDGVSPAPPAGPLAAGESASIALPILPGTGSVLALAAPYELDFAAATGLGPPTVDPQVRVHGTLTGFGRAALFGAGFPTLVAGARYAITGSFTSSVAASLAPFAPVLWVTTEARDADGNLSRHRQLLSDPRLGLTFPTGDPLGVPTLQAPAGPTTGAPQVTWQDRLDPQTLIGGVGFVTLTAVDPAGRRWTLLRFDGDGATGPEVVQLPDLAGLAAAGLAPGAWRVFAEFDLMISATNRDGDFCLEERRRQQVKFARSAAVTFDVR